MGLLALADAAATIFGEFYARSFFTLSGDRKSFVGTLSFIFVSIIWFLILGICGYGFPLNWADYILLSICISVLTASAEAIGSNAKNL